MMPAMILNVVLFMTCLPLVAAIVVGLSARCLSVRWVHSLTTGSVALGLACATYLAYVFLCQHHTPLDVTWYTWLHVGSIRFQVGFLVDSLSVIMAWVVTFISTLVHLYSVGYMKGEQGYGRFFAYVSLFTFAMLMLVMANNGMQLFFGWEGVGAVSYLLIGFWFHKPSAAAGSLKAFLVNRVGDFGFMLGLGALLAYVGSLDYHSIFMSASVLGSQKMHLLSDTTVPVATFVAACLLVGAMGKSAQIPLHVWLPESMEGPTPISALIHAATMVTAGIYMITRFSPLFEQAPLVLNMVLAIGATGALLLGLVGVVQHDIKRVVAYSTLSQLGYMIAATGASAYTAAMFHLLTHAFFKALLFLGAGSVIIALHHEQDMRHMGGLWRKMPVTYVTYVIGTLALVAMPPFAGFFSKDAILMAVDHSRLPAAHYAHFCLLCGAFVTALYSGRSLIMTFHGSCRAHHPESITETAWTMTVPLVLLAIGAVCSGWYLAGAMFQGEHPWIWPQVAHSPIPSAVQHLLVSDFHDRWAFISHGVGGLACLLSLAGLLASVLAYMIFPTLPRWMAERYRLFYRVLEHQWGFDAFNDRLLVPALSRFSHVLHALSDRLIIDRALVMGTARTVAVASRELKTTQTGYLYHYVAAMLLGLLAGLIYLLF